MMFTELQFIPFIVIVVLVANIFLIKKNVKRKFFLTLASYFFYATWNFKLSALIFISTAIDFYCGKKIYEAKTKQHAKSFLILSISANLGFLFFFKYFNFFLENINALFATNLGFVNILLPVGISFYTFQSMSYTIDIYLKKIKPEKKFLNFAFFVSFFPQLVAGPIVRASEFLPQTHGRRIINKSEMAEGIQIFIYGLIKKIVIADRLAMFVDPVFANPTLYSSLTIWLAVISYAIQILFDFSGYSDMAIAIAKMLGFNLIKNFNIPYISQTITEFWSRWHISLSRWIRDYIYIPLGGNRKGELRKYINLLVTMLLGGLWHGASWNFVIWGGLHGFALVIEKKFNFDKEFKNPLLAIGRWTINFVFVLITWVFFRAQSFSTAFIILKKMFFGGLGTTWIFPFAIYYIPLIIVSVFIQNRLNKTNQDYLILNLNKFWHIVILFLAILGIFIFMPDASSPFIYFQF